MNKFKWNFVFLGLYILSLFPWLFIFGLLGMLYDSPKMSAEEINRANNIMNFWSLYPIGGIPLQIFSFISYKKNKQALANILSAIPLAIAISFVIIFYLLNRRSNGI